MCPTSARTLTCSLTLCPQVTYGSFDYTSLLYLSDYLDDFGGGRFVFMEEGANKTVEPRAGRTLRRQPRACRQLGKPSICWPGHARCPRSLPHSTAVPRAPHFLQCIPALSLPGPASPDQVVLEPPGPPARHGHSERPREHVLSGGTVPSLLALVGKGGFAAPARTPRDSQAEPGHLAQAPGPCRPPAATSHLFCGTALTCSLDARLVGAQADQRGCPPGLAKNVPAGRGTKPVGPNRSLSKL